jgi:hypothetical protein
MSWGKGDAIGTSERRLLCLTNLTYGRCLGLDNSVRGGSCSTNSFSASRRGAPLLLGTFTGACYTHRSPPGDFPTVDDILILENCR